jgi:hypothetical protein
MNSNAPLFPPNAQAIRKRLEPNTAYIYEQLDVWTCDQSAQVISGIDPDGFNQNDADNFEGLCKILKAAVIASTLKPISTIDSVPYLKPLSVLKWASDREYKLSSYVMNWYKEKCSNLFEVGLGKDYKTNSTLIPRDGGYKERDEFAIKLIAKNPELLDMRPKEIKAKLLELNPKIFTNGINDWWRKQRIFPKGKPGRVPK